MAQNLSKDAAALICGSVAYDTILVFPDRFKAHILPDKLHTLNVSFLVPDMRREFGGCAANIAYGLNLLGDRGIAMATAGHDFAPYRERMVSQGLSVEHIKVVDGTFTAQAFITTDLDDNQITAFHPGAMQFAHLNRVADAGTGIALGIVAPDGRQAMIEHAAQFEASSIPFIFDPGQGMPMFGGDELKSFIRQARWVAVNDYEWGMLQQKTGLTVAEVAAQVDALIVTQGAEGSIIYTQGAIKMSNSGQLTVEDLEVVRTALDPCRVVAVELAEVELANRDAVKLLAQAEVQGIELRSCPAYIREWITNERESS